MKLSMKKEPHLMFYQEKVLKIWNSLKVASHQHLNLVGLTILAKEMVQIPQSVMLFLRIPRKLRSFSDFMTR